MSRPAPKSVRPNVGKAEYVAQKLIAEGKWNQTINDFLESLGDDSPALLKLEIDQAVRDKLKNDALIAELVKENKNLDATITSKQSRLNSFIHRDLAVSDAQTEILKMWRITAKDGLRGETSFKNWLTGPANMELTSRAGFKNPDQAVQWCKAVGK